MTAPSRRRIETGPDPDTGFTIVEVDGRRSGPTVSVVGGVHGDEFEGVMACLRLADELADDVRGRVRLVAVAHESAHFASTRSSPIDGLNLARTFPGDPNGQPTERLADALRRHVIEGSDAFVDLHSAGTAYAMPLLVGWTDDGCSTCAASGSIAEAFAAPVLWRHPGAVPPGRTLSAAHSAGIPSIYAEAAGGGTLTAAHVTAYIVGVRRVLASLGMLQNPEDPPAGSPIRLAGEGNLDVPAMIAPFDGVCETYVGPLDAVEPGQVVAAVTDPSSGIREEVRSPAAGVVVLARRGARVTRSENLVVLADADGADPLTTDTLHERADSIASW
jgi:N2-acetyl-L-2,4-diaminobutanoate deacetylase